MGGGTARRLQRGGFTETTAAFRSSTTSADRPRDRRELAARDRCGREVFPVCGGGSTRAGEEPGGLLPAAEEVRPRAGEPQAEQGETEGDVADRLERAPAVAAEL